MTKQKEFIFKTYLFSWITWLPIFFFNLDTTTSPEGIIIFMIGGFGPSIIGFYEIYIKGTKKTKKEFWDQLFNLKRFDRKWLFITLFLYPCVFTISFLIDYIFISKNFPEATQLKEMVKGIVPFISNTMFILLLGPVAEEIGWRGYLLDKIQKIMSPMKASLAIGIVWWAWHLPLFFMRGTLHGDQGLISFFTIGYFFTVVAYSIIFTWLYNVSNRSILIAILAHFSINFTIATFSPFSGMIFVMSTFILLGIGGILYIPHLIKNAKIR